MNNVHEWVLSILLIQVPCMYWTKKIFNIRFEWLKYQCGYCFFSNQIGHQIVEESHPPHIENPLVNKHSYWKWQIIVDLPIENGIFHSYVSLPEGTFERFKVWCVTQSSGLCQSTEEFFDVFSLTKAAEGLSRKNWVPHGTPKFVGSSPHLY